MTSPTTHRRSVGRSGWRCPKPFSPRRVVSSVPSPCQSPRLPEATRGYPAALARLGSDGCTRSAWPSFLADMARFIASASAFRALDGHVGPMVTEREVEFVVLVPSQEHVLGVPIVVVVVADEACRFNRVLVLLFLYLPYLPSPFFLKGEHPGARTTWCVRGILSFRPAPQVARIPPRSSACWR